MSLKIKNLSKKYTKDYIFSNFSYNFDDKGLYLIVGESGVGKTTLLRIILGLDKDYEGEIEGAYRVSAAFQEYRLFDSMSALENSYLEATDKIKKAEELLLRLGLSKKALKSKPGELSGGMKQRVSIVRAILRDSDVLCLDEPTKEIDKENIKRLVALIEEQSQKRLVIVVTHTEEDFFGTEYTKISL